MKRKYKNDTDDELQAQLKGLVMKMYGSSMTNNRELQTYGDLITELTLRNLEPVVTLIPKGE